MHLLCPHQTASARCLCVSQTYAVEGHTYCCELYGVPSYQLQLPADKQYLLNILAASTLTMSTSTADYGMYGIAESV